MMDPLDGCPAVCKVIIQRPLRLHRRRKTITSTEHYLPDTSGEVCFVMQVPRRYFNQVARWLGIDAGSFGPDIAVSYNFPHPLYLLLDKALHIRTAARE